MIAAELFDKDGTKVATAVLHKGKITVRTDDRALEHRLIAFFNAPETIWENGQRKLELTGTEAHFLARCRGLHRHGLTAAIG